MTRKNRKRTREYCEQVARKYSSLKDLCTMERSVSNKAFAEGWIDDYTWLSRERARRNSLTEEECARISRQFSTLREFRLGNPSAYVISTKNGWIQSFTWLQREIGKKTYHTREELAELSKRFRTAMEFRTNCYKEYHYAWEHGWLNDFIWLEKTTRGRKRR